MRVDGWVSDLLGSQPMLLYTDLSVMVGFEPIIHHES